MRAGLDSNPSVSGLAALAFTAHQLRWGRCGATPQAGKGRSSPDAPRARAVVASGITQMVRACVSHPDLQSFARGPAMEWVPCKARASEAFGVSRLEQGPCWALTLVIFSNLIPTATLWGRQ